MKAATLETERTGFKRFLPVWLFPTEPVQTRASQESRPAIPSQELPVPVPNGRRVLIVDDDAVVRLVTTTVLRNRGYEVVAAADCSEAIGAIAEKKPDVVLLDLNFPPDIAGGGGISWDGLRLMYWLRGLENSKGARFIIITSSDSEQTRKRALAGGAVGFFQKPINHELLLEVIEREFDLTPKETPRPKLNSFEI